MGLDHGVHETGGTPQRTNERTAKQQQARITQVRNQQRELLDAFLDDSLPRELLSEKQEALKAELHEAERILELVEGDAGQLGSVVQELLDAVRDFEATRRC